MKYFFLIFILLSNISATLIRDNINNIILDTSTQLVWQDNIDSRDNKNTWINAINYCSNLNLALKSDWRLPNINELNSIIDTNGSSNAIKNNFNYVNSGNYWSSTSYGRLNWADEGWFIDFSSAVSSHAAKTNSYSLRCVRDLK